MSRLEQIAHLKEAVSLGEFTDLTGRNSVEEYFDKYYHKWQDPNELYERLCSDLELEPKADLLTKPLPFAKWKIGGPENLAEWEAHDEKPLHEEWFFGRADRGHGAGSYAVLLADRTVVMETSSNGPLAEYLIEIHNAQIRCAKRNR